MASRSLATLAAALAVAGAAVASERVDIISEPQLGQRWTMASGVVRVMPGYPSSVADKSRDVCVTMGYRIDKEGKTVDFVEIKSWTNDAGNKDPAPAVTDPYVQLSAAAISRWRYAPVGEKPRSVYTATTFAFDGSEPLAADAISAKCRIEDLKKFVDRAKSQQSEALLERERRREVRAQGEPVRYGD